MPFWYFLTVPKLPSEIAEQSNQVRIREYLCSEGELIEAGTPIVLVENRWAAMLLKANGKGIVRKTLFDCGTYVKVGDPIAIIGADGENIPYGKDYALIEIAEHKQPKPGY